MAPGYLAYGWHDANGDRLVQPDEVDFSDFKGAVGIDPTNPTAAGSTPDKVDRNLKAPHTNEVIAGPRPRAAAELRAWARPTPTATSAT